MVVKVFAKKNSRYSLILDSKIGKLVVYVLELDNVSQFVYSFLSIVFEFDLFFHVL